MPYVRKARPEEAARFAIHADPRTRLIVQLRHELATDRLLIAELQAELARVRRLAYLNTPRSAWRCAACGSDVFAEHRQSGVCVRCARGA